MVKNYSSKSKNSKFYFILYLFTYLSLAFIIYLSISVFCFFVFYVGKYIKIFLSMCKKVFKYFGLFVH